MAAFESEGLPVLRNLKDWKSVWLNGSFEDWGQGQLAGRKFIVHQSRVCHFPYACNFCKRSGILGASAPPLSRCAKCKRVFYCCRAHQSKDWAEHKNICSSMAAVPLLERPLHSIEAWRGHLLSAMGVEQILREPQYAFYWNFQPHCQSCYKQTDLVQCPTCFAVAHCASESCKAKFALEHTAQKCELHCIRIASFVMALQQGNWLRVPCQTRCDAGISPGAAVVAAAFPLTWGHYFTAKAGDFELPIQLIQLPPVMAQLTDGMSLILTALHAMQTLSVATTQEVVTIHMVGTEADDMIGAHVQLEEFLHWLPQCRVLNIVMVGPNMPIHPTEAGEKVPVISNMCAGCMSKGCKAFMTIVPDYYHNQTYDEKPDLIICGNTGLHDGSSTDMIFEGGEEGGYLSNEWEPTLKLIASMGTPTVFTAFAENEIIADYQQLQNVCEVTADAFPVGPTRNPFRGLLPMPDVFTDNEFFYNNNYYLVMRTSARIAGSSSSGAM